MKNRINQLIGQVGVILAEASEDEVSGLLKSREHQLSQKTLDTMKKVANDSLTLGFVTDEEHATIVGLIGLSPTPEIWGKLPIATQIAVSVTIRNFTQSLLDILSTDT